MAEKIHMRIDQISAADSVEMLVRYHIGRCHGLQGDRKGQYAMDLVHPYRLIFTKEDSHTVSVRIEEIEDYRYCQTKLKHFSLCFMYRGVLISLIVHEAWAIRFSVAKMLPHPDHMAAAA